MTAAALETQSTITNIGDRSQHFLLNRPYAIDIAYTIWRAGLIPLVANEGQRPEKRLRQTVENHLQDVFENQWRVWSKDQLQGSIGVLLHSGLVIRIPIGTIAIQANGDFVHTTIPALGVIPAVANLLQQEVKGTCPKCHRSVFLKSNQRAADCRYRMSPEHDS